MELEDCFRKGLLVKGPADVESARRSLKLARQCINDAEKIMPIDSYRPVILWSYTAMFHAARAILFLDGIRERSHECIPLYLQERYPALYASANLLDTYRKYRHEAIYGLEFEAGKNDALTAIAVAKEFVSTVERAIK